MALTPRNDTNGKLYGGYIERGDSWDLIGKHAMDGISDDEEVLGIVVNIVNKKTKVGRWRFYSCGIENHAVKDPQDGDQIRAGTIETFRVNPQYYPLPGGDIICVP